MARHVAVQIGPSGTYNQLTEGEKKLLPANWSNEPFTYYHYPLAWLWDLKHGFYPNLNVMRHRAACNGVEEVRDGSGAIIKGRVNATHAHSGCRGKGGIEIDPADPRLKDWMHFIKKVQCEGGGTRYVFGVGAGPAYKGERFKRLANNQIQHIPAGDLYLEFCAFLRDNDLVHPVDESTVEGLIDQKEKSRDLVLKLGGESKFAAGVADRLNAEIDAMRIEWDKIRAANVVELAGDDADEVPVEDAEPRGGGVQIGSAP